MSVLRSRFEFQPSRCCGLLIATAGAIALISLFIIPISPLSQATAAGLLAWAFGKSLYRLAWLQDHGSVCGMVFREKNPVIILDKNGNGVDMGTITYCAVSSFLSTVVIAGSRRNYRVLLLPDSLPPDEYRHLRIHLNAGSGQQPAEQKA